MLIKKIDRLLNRDRKFRSLVLAGLVWLLIAGSAGKPVPGKQAAADHPLKVLFIGNSYTYFNNLPRLLEKMAASAPKSKRLETKMIAEGGATLKDHWEKGDALKAIRERVWDYVILQEQSVLGNTYIVNGQERITDPQPFHKYARLFDEESKKAGARTIFYLTWARQDAVPREQAMLNYAYMTIARKLKEPIAPVGIVWQKIRQEQPKLALYIQDQSHPTGAGSYVAASVLYTVLYGESPVGLRHTVTGNPIDADGNIDTTKEETLVNLSAGEAMTIQQTAWLTYQKMKAAGGYLPAPKPPPPELPTLPAGRAPSATELAGVWVGRLKFYPVPWPATMTLQLRRVGEQWAADLQIHFEGRPAADKNPQITGLTITDKGISFVDQKGINGTAMSYQAAFTGSSLSGIAEVKATDGSIYAIGTWELRRQ